LIYRLIDTMDRSGRREKLKSKSGKYIHSGKHIRQKENFQQTISKKNDEIVKNGGKRKK
jgi:hypothetical protein